MARLRQGNGQAGATVTRKDYIRLARAVATVRNGVISMRDSPNPFDADSAVVLMTLTLATELAADNSEFNRDKFYEACGVYPAYVKAQP